MSYTLDSGIKVVYPPTEVGFYLACLYRSLFEHDQLLRRMLVGLAGKNIRKAMEIFLDFCKSGHIGGKEFLQIRIRKGDYCLPYKIVTRVLMRLNRRFYDGNESHLKNVFQCDPTDPRPDHFVRLAILRWLHDKFRHHGPTGVKAFHRAEQMIYDLVPFGHDADRIRAELRYLVEAMCVLTEHQRTDQLSDEDLICLSAAGHAHLHAAANFDYLAACAEDTWVSDVVLAQRVASRIGDHGIRGHYARETIRTNAEEFIGHLVGEAASEIASPKKYLSHAGRGVRDEVEMIRQKVSRKVGEERAKDSWHQVDTNFKLDGVYDGTVQNVADYGVFVDLAKGLAGLLHWSKLGSRDLGTFRKGESLRVRILAIDREAKQISLGLEG
jgi:S1 RNA binding domain